MGLSRVRVSISGASLEAWGEQGASDLGRRRRGGGFLALTKLTAVMGKAGGWGVRVKALGSGRAEWKGSEAVGEPSRGQPGKRRARFSPLVSTRRGLRGVFSKTTDLGERS